MRSEEEIQDQRAAAAEIAATEGTRVRGMSYEEGVRDALEWVTEETDDAPIEED